MQDKQGVQQDLLEVSNETDGVPAQAVRQVGPTRGGEQFAFDVGNADQHSGACPDCGSQLEFAEGCVKCHVCGYSECG